MTKAHDHFGSSNGSNKFYYHQPSRISISSGVKQLVDTCSAHWLIELIISYQSKRNIKREPLKVWDLKRIKDNRFTMIVTDGNNNCIAYQYILYSNFTYDQAILWVVNGCIMLPKEY